MQFVPTRHVRNRAACSVTAAGRPAPQPHKHDGKVPALYRIHNNYVITIITVAIGPRSPQESFMHALQRQVF